MSSRGHAETSGTHILPGLAGIYAALQPLTYPLIRFTTGALLVPHGWAKIFGGAAGGTAGFLTSLGIEPAYPIAIYLGLLELVGGRCIAFGLLTRPMAVQVVVFMAVAAFYVHLPNGPFWTKGGFEFPLFLGIVALVIAIKGGGRWSPDRMIGREF